MKQIGPILSVNDDFVPNMQDAYGADNERGSHALNNEASERLSREWPTALAMAALIEKERDELKLKNEQLIRRLANAIAVIDDYRLAVKKLMSDCNIGDDEGYRFLWFINVMTRDSYREHNTNYCTYEAQQKEKSE